MNKRISLGRIVVFSFFLAVSFLIGKPEMTYAYTYENSRTENINYRATFLNGQDTTTSNGGAIALGNAGNCDNIWMNGFSAWVSGDYSGGVTYCTHRHNVGWGPTLGNGSLLVGNTGNYEWIEAISLKTTGDLNNYYYLYYRGLCIPVTRGYLVQASGGSESDLNVWNPGWEQNYLNGQSVWYQWIRAGQNIASGSGLATGAPDGSNFCGTAGYSLPLNGFSASLYKYSCTLVVNPNGGNSDGNTNMYTIGGLNVDGTVTFTPPTREGYEFTGWTIIGTEYQTRTAATCQQQPDYNVAPTVNGNSVYLGNARKVTIQANWKQKIAYGQDVCHYYHYPDTDSYKLWYQESKFYKYDGEYVHPTFSGSAHPGYTAKCQRFMVLIDGTYVNPMNHNSKNPLVCNGDGTGYYVDEKSSNVNWLTQLIYDANQYELKFDANKPQEAQNTVNLSMTSKRVYYDTAVGSLASASLKGYAFEGWWTAPSGGKKVGEGTIFNNSTFQNLTNTGSATVYAHWRPLNYTVHFDGNGATGGSTPDQTMQYDIPAKLNKNGFVRSFQIGYDGNGGTPEKGSDTTVSDFTGWLISPGAINVSYSDEQSVTNIAEPGKTRNLYAGWHDNAVTLPNASKADEYWEISEENKGWVRYYFTGWYTAPDGGSCVGRGGDAYVPKQDITLYAHWTYNVFVYYDGNTNDGGGMEMTDPAKGDEKTRGVDYVIRENNFTKTGYDFAGWNTAQIDGAGNIVETGILRFTPGSVYNEDIPLTLYAAWQNRFDIAYMGVCQTEGDDYFDNNGGADYSQLTDTVKLAKSDDLKTQTTKSFVDPESGEEITENVTGTGVGWAFAKDIEAKYKEAYIADDTEYPARDFFTLARDAGAVTYGSVSPDYQSAAPQLNSPDMAVANMYRVWDYGPLVEAYDLYYTLDQAQSGYITEDELLSHAKAEDEEDGEIPGGDHVDQGNSFRVMDYSETDFLGFETDGSVTETYLATDSVGNQTKLKITVHITDSSPGKVMPAGTTRFISEKYYKLPYEEGGLEENSIWKQEPDYQKVLEQTFANQQSKSAEITYCFDHDTICAMREALYADGIKEFMDTENLLQFYDRFLSEN